MTPAGTSSSLKRVTLVGMSHASQCVNVPPGASGSVTSSARLIAFCGTLPKSSSGDTAAPLHVYFCGIEPPSAKAGLVIVIAPVGAGGSGALPGGTSFRFGFMHETESARVMTRAKRERIISPSGGKLQSGHANVFRRHERPDGGRGAAGGRHRRRHDGECAAGSR